MPTTALPGFHQIFADNFPASEDTPVGSFSNCNWASTLPASDCTGLPASDLNNWFAYPDGTCDTTCDGKYEPSQDVSIANNLMNINMHTDPATGTPGVVAVEPKANTGTGNGQLYGVFSVRFETNTATGYSLSFLLWPDSNVWPQDGEIDFPETDSELGGPVSAFMHWMGATSGSQQDAFTTNTTTTSWHTYTIEWTPTMVRFYLDGQIVGTSTGHIPSTPMHWVLQTTTNLGGVMPIAGQSGNIQVAWVVDYGWNS